MGEPWTPRRKRKKRKFLSSIFSKEEKGISVIGEGLSIDGTINFGQEVVRLDGRIEGEINGQGTLIIGPKGMFQGEMIINKLILGGCIEGTVKATAFAQITRTGKLQGRIQAAQLLIEEGGKLEGKSEKMIL